MGNEFVDLAGNLGKTVGEANRLLQTVIVHLLSRVLLRNAIKRLCSFFQCSIAWGVNGY